MWSWQKRLANCCFWTWSYTFLYHRYQWWLSNQRLSDNQLITWTLIGRYQCDSKIWVTISEAQKNNLSAGKLLIAYHLISLSVFHVFQKRFIHKSRHKSIYEDNGDLVMRVISDKSDNDKSECRVEDCIWKAEKSDIRINVTFWIGVDKSLIKLSFALTDKDIRRCRWCWDTSDGENSNFLWILFQYEIVISDRDVFLEW